MGWSLADQGISSITNLALGIVVARSVDASEFGAFSLALVTYGVVLNLSRGLATDPLTVRYSGLPDQRWRSAVARSSSTAAFVGLGAGAVCVLIGSAIAGMVGSCLVALGLTLPGLILQDSWRYAFFAAGQGQRAFVNDAIWTAALIPTMLLAGTVGTCSPSSSPGEGQPWLRPSSGAGRSGWCLGLRASRDGSVPIVTSASDTRSRT